MTGAETGTATVIATGTETETAIAGETGIIVAAQVKMTRYSLPKSRNGGGSKRRPRRPIGTNAPCSRPIFPSARLSRSSSNSSARLAKCMMYVVASPCPARALLCLSFFYGRV